jgi:hypothetical protein
MGPPSQMIRGCVGVLKNGCKNRRVSGSETDRLFDWKETRLRNRIESTRIERMASQNTFYRQQASPGEAMGEDGLIRVF